MSQLKGGATEQGMCCQSCGEPMPSFSNGAVPMGFTGCPQCGGCSWVGNIQIGGSPVPADPNRLIRIDDGQSTHARTAAEWIALARRDFETPRSESAGFDDLTPNLSEAEKVWRCRTCGVEQDSSGPVATTKGTP